MVSIVCRLALTMALLLLPASALGAWRAVDGIDIATGRPSLLLIGDLDQRTSLYARCVDGHAELFVDSYDGGDFEIAPVGPVSLTVTTDTGRSWSSEARYAREKSGYITTTWLTRETISPVVAELAAAKAAISINVEFAESGVSTWDTDAKGSTAAGRRFLEACPPTRFADLPAPAAPARPPAEPPAQGQSDPEPSAPAALPDPETDALPEMTLQLDESGPVLRLTGRLDDQTVLTFNCDGNGSVVLISNDGQDAETRPDLAFNLSIAVNSGTPWVGPAKVRRLAPGYLGFYHVPDHLGIWELLGAVMEASSRFDIGLEDAATGARLSWSRAPVGFGTPVFQFYNQCMLATFNPPPASSPEGTTWQTFSTDAGEATLVGGLEHDARLMATCDSGKNVTLSLIAPDLPYQIGDVGLNLHLDIDGEDRVSTGEVFDAADGLTGVAYTGEYVAGAIQALAQARTGVGLKVQNYADGSIAEWRALDLEGLAAAAQNFNATCFGTVPRQADAGSPVGPIAAPSRIQAGAGFEPNQDWAVALADQVTLPNVKAVLMGRTNPAGLLQMTCGTDPRKWSLGLATTDPPGTAIKASDGPFTIGIEVDGSTWSFPDAQYTESSTEVSVIAEAGTDLAGALIMMTLSFNPVKLTVTGASGEARVYSVDIAGMGEASMAMSGACLG